MSRASWGEGSEVAGDPDGGWSTEEGLASQTIPLAGAGFPQDHALSGLHGAQGGGVGKQLDPTGSTGGMATTKMVEVGTEGQNGLENGGVGGKIP